MSSLGPLPPAQPVLPSSVPPASAPVAAAHKGAAGASDPRLHRVAKQFESVFLSEMLRLSRPPDKAAPGFGAGEAGGTWQVFMDQALGDAAAAKGGTGLTKQIEEALRRAQGNRGSGR